MEHYNFVFVVLCYKEHHDLENLIENLKDTVTSHSYKIIVVNSYFDDFSRDSIRDIALKNDCDFVNVDNRGYGYGNNRGIEFVLSKYNFDFICICNPDIEFLKFNPIDFKNFKNKNVILAPQIKTLKNKNQNPYYYKRNKLVEYLKFRSFNKNKKILFYLAVVINKISRELVIRLNKDLKKIYACHGSCYFISSNAIKIIGLPYNEKMFLFNEEEHLARLAKKLKIDTFMTNQLSVLHYEDGSSEDINDKVYQYMKESYLENHKNWNGEIG